MAHSAFACPARVCVTRLHYPSTVIGGIVVLKLHSDLQLRVGVMVKTMRRHLKVIQHGRGVIIAVLQQG